MTPYSASNHRSVFLRLHFYGNLTVWIPGVPQEYVDTWTIDARGLNWRGGKEAPFQERCHRLLGVEA